ncbi:hypothetical protein FNV43_RR04008 [Rhamnella rubrinervis]|uniref:non-specific serine/threonine protein kinase n=1 Tax=Rhamnella rubrinervis TaxID=2594499 RepID=A0A8K0HL25_9ROSA|nr:hypothetical protein FNV43_RR04008 [Rhamnella rubrinervis]
MGVCCFVFIRANFLLLLFSISVAVDSLRSSQTLSDGKTLVSREGSFELGFFNPGTSKNRYLGIWYKQIPVTTVVWVANRCNPINDSSGLLTINTTGSLVLLGQNKSVVWWMSSVKQPQNPLLQILDSGNLVLRDEEDGNPEAYLWQSFDYPTDTLLSDMKLGWDLRTGLKRGLSAWKNPEDPCPGDFIIGIELGPHTYPEVYIRKGNVKFYRTGPWNGLRYSGSPELRPNPLYGYHFVYNDDEVYYMYNLMNKSVISRIVLNQTTNVRERSTWIEADQTWKQYSSVPRDLCDSYGLCGANGKCIFGQNPVCGCLEGFKPKSQGNWNIMDWSQGCERNVPLSCPEKHNDGFFKFDGLKLPDTTKTWVDKSMNLEECRAKCLSNCSCMAYTNSDIRGKGSGCVHWFDDLVDIRGFPDGGQDLYVRMPASELKKRKKARGNDKMKLAMIDVAVIGVVSGMLFLGFYICRRRTAALEENTRRNEIVSHNNGGQKEDLELPLFDLSTIATATNNFSLANKLGEGGFGPVYKGMLDDGQEIAVKRLSVSSGQGVNEFKNEVILFAKLQHRNLVKLLGCCIQGEEKMLVYEYMPNKSLDSLIFDDNQGKLLEWSRRFQIICGIARGLLYLHQDSRLRIIHRDLKASNVLLDKEMNPKISDFGMARIFGGDQTEGNTNRVVGTYGYMAPEYAFDGQFSTKSDVFSFGILMLEIICGKRSRGYHHDNHGITLIGHAWTLMQEGRPFELIDAQLSDYSQCMSQVLRCIHVSLLCVQQNPVDRPCMSSVVLMLSSEGALVQPKPPGYYMETDFHLAEAYSSSMDSLRSSQSLSDGKTLVSRGGGFELGFFSPGTSKNRYLGIWYKHIPVTTVVWVANRCNPINDSSGLLTINNTGSLVLLGQNKSVVWWTSSVKQPQNPLLQILDSGNLVLRDEEDGNPEAYLWQSFDYPTDTLLPDMKMGWDLRTGLKRGLSAWKNPEDPCPGDFIYGIELGPHTYPEAYIRKGNVKFYRTGPWNGLRYSGSPELKPNPLYGYHFVYNDDEVYYMYNLMNKSVISRIVLNQTTSMRERSTWIEADQTWRQYSSVPRDLCDNYGLCGANGKCIIGQNPVCGCLEGFKPKSQGNWNIMDWSQGCERNVPLSCQEKHSDGFFKFDGLKLPDTTKTWVDKSMNLEECRAKCLSNCSCMAYTNSDIRGEGSGCVHWFDDLVDIRGFPDGGQDLYVRMPASELKKRRKARGNDKMKLAIIVVAVIGVVSGMLFLGFYICRRRAAASEENTRRNEIVSQNDGGQKEDLELPLFDLSTIATATNNFSLANKLGKGMLDDGQEIAVKRLSVSSGQGVNEFKNEVILFAKLQHRNLVKLLGCCIQGEEKMLVYEYMPNKSLDSLIFDEKQGKQLKWTQRFQIICGIARGLLYLHQDSRLRIIHRDLKASNVLLDKEMNPKISDFGMARTFGGDQTEGNTNRVVGTYGYMAPEYAFDGQFSTKSDVFSFGILMLEIISGKKSRGFHHQNQGMTLIGYAWSLMQKGKPHELIDACTEEYSQYEMEVLRCIHVSLLCVQQRPVDRPSMSSVVLMLGSESALVQPKPPGYFMETDYHSAEADSSSSNKHASSSTNDMTISEMVAR